MVVGPGTRGGVYLLREHAKDLTRAAIEARNYDLKAVNPNARTRDDVRTPSDLLDLIEAKGQEVADALAPLRALQQSVVRA